MRRSCKLTCKVYFHDTYRTSFVPFVAEIQTSWTRHLKLCLSFWVPEFAFAISVQWYGITDPGFSLRTCDARPSYGCPWRGILTSVDLTQFTLGLAFRSTWSKMPWSQIIQIGEWSPNITYCPHVTMFWLELRRNPWQTKSSDRLSKGWNQKKKRLTEWIMVDAQGSRVWDCSSYDVFWWRKTKWKKHTPKQVFGMLWRKKHKGNMFLIKETMILILDGWSLVDCNVLIFKSFNPFQKPWRPKLRT